MCCALWKEKSVMSLNGQHYPFVWYSGHFWVIAQNHTTCRVVWFCAIIILYIIYYINVIILIYYQWTIVTAHVICLHKKGFHCLQSVQNAWQTHTRQHITPILDSLPWLPLHFTTHCKFSVLTLKPLCVLVSLYISDLFRASYLLLQSHIIWSEVVGAIDSFLRLKEDLLKPRVMKSAWLFVLTLLNRFKSE